MTKSITNRFSMLFLKFVICFISVGILTALIWFPQTEGRAINLNLISIYTYPFILYIYIGSTPFFIGLYQAFKLLNLINTNNNYSQTTIKILKYIEVTCWRIIPQRNSHLRAYNQLVVLPTIIQPSQYNRQLRHLLDKKSSKMR